MTSEERWDNLKILISIKLNTQEFKDRPGNFVLTWLQHKINSLEGNIDLLTSSEDFDFCDNNGHPYYHIVK